MQLRPIRDVPDDLAAVNRIRRAAFEITTVDERAETRSLDRTRHLATTDPAGCWLADVDDEPVGAALSMRREGTWVLSLFVVLPDHQGRGIGRALLDRADRHSAGCTRAMLCASSAQPAVRSYRRAGFTLHPAMRLRGPIRRIPQPGKDIHAGTDGHRELLDAVDRQVRGAAHGPDHDFLFAHGTELLVHDTAAAAGYCYRDNAGVRLLAATDTRTAAALLSTALARLPADADAEVEHLTADQQWAVDVGLEAGLNLETHGYVALRGMTPPAPYIPQGGFL
jgi:GNAT superfamily N-acetyltransferase